MKYLTTSGELVVERGESIMIFCNEMQKELLCTGSNRKASEGSPKIIIRVTLSGETEIFGNVKVQDLNKFYELPKSHQAMGAPRDAPLIKK